MALISRKNFLALTALVLLQSGLPIANAAVGPTLKPTRLGQKIIWRGKKYTAIKSGKKLIWNKGVALPAPSEVPNGETCAIELGVPHLLCNCHLSYFNRISGVVEGGPVVDLLRD